MPVNYKGIFSITAYKRYLIFFRLALEYLISEFGNVLSVESVACAEQRNANSCRNGNKQKYFFHTIVYGSVTTLMRFANTNF